MSDFRALHDDFDENKRRGPGPEPGRLRARAYASPSAWRCCAEPTTNTSLTHASASVSVSPTRAAALSEPRDILEDVYEPFLLQRGFLVRTPRGRQVTRKARTHLKKRPDDDSDDGPDPQGLLDL